MTHQLHPNATCHLWPPAGMDGALDKIMDADDLINDDDLDLEICGPGSSKGGAAKQPAAELMANLAGLSARERNKLKRQAKAQSKSGAGERSCSALLVLVAQPATRHRSTFSYHISDPNDYNTYPCNNFTLIFSYPAGRQAALERKTSGGSGTIAVPAAAAVQPPSGPNDPNTACGGDADDEGEWMAVAAGGWPFQSLCDQLCVDILDPAWEVRHGAAVALREVLRSQAAAAGVAAPVADAPSGWGEEGGEGA